MGKPLSFSKIPPLHFFSACMALNSGNLNLWLFGDNKHGIVQTWSLILYSVSGML